MFKLLLSWDIQSGRERLYENFMVDDFLPALNAMGLEPSEVWYSLYGEGADVLMGCTVEDKEQLSALLQSRQWVALQRKLIAHVANYHCKLVQDNGYYFQM